MQAIGRVSAAWRYPVSSARGERRPWLDAGPDGLAGDRCFAVTDAATGQTATPERERRWHPTPLLQAALTASGRPELRLPNEAGPADEAALSRHFGFPVRVVAYADGARHRYRPAQVHLLTTASLRALAAELPGSDMDPARFRPNLLVDTPPTLAGTVEQGWIGRELLVGTVRLAVNRSCGRCSFTSLPQDGLGLDRSILRALIRGHARQFGVLCQVVGAGRMAENDAVVLL